MMALSSLGREPRTQGPRAVARRRQNQAVTGWVHFQVDLWPMVESPSCFWAVFASLFNNPINLFSSSASDFRQDVGFELCELLGPIVDRIVTICVDVGFSTPTTLVEAIIQPTWKIICVTPLR